MHQLFNKEHKNYKKILPKVYTYINAKRNKYKFCMTQNGSMITFNCSVKTRYLFMSLKSACHRNRNNKQKATFL